MDKDLKAFRVFGSPEQKARRRAKGQIYPVSIICLRKQPLDSGALALTGAKRLLLRRRRRGKVLEMTFAEFLAPVEQKCELRSGYLTEKKRKEELAAEVK